MSKVKVKYFINNDEYEGLPEKLEKDTHYKIYYYYEGHEPTAGWSDTFSVSVSFSVTS